MSASPSEARAVDDFTGRLAEIEGGTSLATALAFFDVLPVVRVDEIFAMWQGSEIPTGHPMNGLLGPLGWYGKELIDAETVHPLVFRDGDGKPFNVDPRKMPTSMASQVPRAGIGAGQVVLSILKSVVGTSKPRARLRHVEYRGKVSATMIYDHLPILDAFRRVDADTLLGAMDQRGMPDPLLFVLRRAAR